MPATKLIFLTEIQPFLFELMPLVNVQSYENLILIIFASVLDCTEEQTYVSLYSAILEVALPLHTD